MLPPEASIVIISFREEHYFIICDGSEDLACLPANPFYKTSRHGVLVRYLPVGLVCLFADYMFLGDVFLGDAIDGTPPELWGIGVHDDEGGDFLALGLQLDRGLVGQDPSGGGAQQVIRAAWLHGTDLFDIVLGHFADRTGEFALPVETSCLQSIKPEVVWNIASQGHVAPAQPAGRV